MGGRAILNWTNELRPRRADRERGGIRGSVEGNSQEASSVSRPREM